MSDEQKDVKPEVMEKNDTRMTDLEKANADLRAQFEKAQADLAKAQADAEKAQADASAAMAEVAKERERGERETFIVKARNFASVPASPVDLGEQLYALSKWDEERATWWTDLLKAVDALAEDANLFIEKGTIGAPEQDAIAKAMKSDDPRTALLNVSTKDQELYLSQMRAKARQAK